MKSNDSGMSPRKQMASAGGGSFGVEPLHKMQGSMGQHPDASARTGQKPHMADNERAIGAPVKHAKGHHPAQAAPQHGPHHPGGYGDHHGAGDKV